MVVASDAADKAEICRAFATRRALPPAVCVAVSVLHRAVARLVVVVLRSLAAPGISEAAEDFHLGQKEQGVLRGIDGGTLVTCGAELFDLDDSVLQVRCQLAQQGCHG